MTTISLPSTLSANERIRRTHHQITAHQDDLRYLAERLRPLLDSLADLPGSFWDAHPDEQPWPELSADLETSARNLLAASAVLSRLDDTLRHHFPLLDD